MAGKFDAAPAPDAAPAAAPAAATTAPRTSRAKAAPKDAPAIFLVAGDDVKVEIPVGSPLHTKALAVLEALYS